MSTDKLKKYETRKCQRPQPKRISQISVTNDKVISTLLGILHNNFLFHNYISLPIRYVENEIYKQKIYGITIM